MRAAQKNLFEHFEMKHEQKRYGRTKHGGAQVRGRRKLERPLDKNRWLHLVLKSDKAKGKLSFRTAQNQILVKNILYSKAGKFGVRVADYVNVGNHLHVKVKITNRSGFQKFLKATTALIARKITGARRGHKFGRFWEGLAFTRVLKSRMEELRLKGYFDSNRIESEEGYEARETYRGKFNQWVNSWARQESS